MLDSDLYKLIKTIDYIHTVGDVDYQVLHLENYCILLFQETRSNSDWKVNFDFPCKMYKKGKIFCHKGYAETYKKVKDEIMYLFLTELSKTDEIPLITGWSYGASLSVLASEDFFYRTGQKPITVTFGGAKICYTLGTKKYLNSCMNLVEYTQVNDFVTWVVPFCFRINGKRIGEKFSFKKLLNTVYYHCNYDRYLE